MRDEHRRSPDRSQQADDLGADLGAQVRVEAGERLVEQHQRRRWGHGPRQGNPLALSAGQLVRVAPAIAAEADEIEPPVDAPLPFGPCHVAQPEGDVVRHGEMREQSVLLEDESDAPPLRVDSTRPVVHQRPSDADRAAIDTDESGDQSQQRRLPAPARAHESEQLLAGELHGDVVDRHRRPERLADSVERQRGLGRSSVTHRHDRWLASRAHTTAPGSTGGTDASRWSSWRQRIATGISATAMIVMAGSAACSNRLSEARL